MANSPHADTVTVSFTLPRGMSDAIERLAKQNLTNKSDIIRRALLAYLPSNEAALIRGLAMQNAPKPGKSKSA